MDPQLDEPDLRSYLGTISRRKWLVAAVTLVFFGVAVAMSFLAEPEYKLRLQVQTRAPAASDRGLTHAEFDRLAETELVFVGSGAMAREVQRAYDGPLPLSEIHKVSAQDLGSQGDRVSNAVELSYVTSDPDEGANMLSTYARAYVTAVQVEEEEHLQELLGGIRSQLAGIDDEIDEIESARSTLRDQIAETDDPALEEQLQTDLTVEEERTDPELQLLRSDRADLRSTIRNLEGPSGLADTRSAKVLGFVGGRSSPVSPNIPQNLAIGLVFGLFLGIAAAFTRDYFDDSVASKDAVERVTGAPAVGLIPKFDTGDTELIAAVSSSSPATEAFRSLRTSVKFTSVERDARIIQVTSASASEGKTVTAANLATVLAQAGDRVLLVSADLRRPRVEELLGVPLTPGLTGVLIGEVTLPQAVRMIDGVPNLSVLPSGQPPTNPSELLSGERARRLVEVLGQTYDIVVLDCPPLLPVTDSLVLARMADTTLLVTSARHSSRRELERAVELLNRMAANLAGCVITGLTPDDAYSEPYGYDTVVPPQHTPRRPPGKVADDYSPAPETAANPLVTGGVPAVWQPQPEGMPDGAGQGPVWPSELPPRS